MRALAASLLAALCLAAPAWAAEPRASLADIEDEVMCVECGTALSLSRAPVAEREREFIRREIARGRTKEQIKAALVERMGPGVLALPENEGFNVAAYLVPAIFVALSLVGVVVAARRWRGPPGRPPEPPPPPLDAADARRLERELRAYGP
jgi:cytochrome c-type biogenesis protein CcmH